MKLIIKSQYGIVFLLSFLYSILYYNYGINFIDEGFNLNSMKKISEGLLPFKDFFLLQTPGHLYLGAILMTIFGKSILMTRVFTAITSAMFSLIVFYFLRKMTNIYFSSVGLIVSLVFGLSIVQISPSYSWNAVILGSMSVIFFIRNMEQNKIKWIILSGVCLFLAGFFKQTIGFYFLVGYCITFLLLKIYKKDKIKDFAILFLTPTMLTVFYFIYLISQHSVHDFIQDAILLPLTDFKEAKLPPPTLADLKTIFIDFKPWNFFSELYFLQLLILAVSLVIVIKKLIKRNFDLHFFVIFIFACTTFMHNYERASFLKVRTTLPLVLILMIYLIYKLYCRRSTRLISIMLVGILIISSIIGIYSKIDSYKQYTDLFPYKEKIYVPKEVSQKYTNLFKAVENNIPKNEKVFIYPCNPMLYFILDKQNPTRYSELMAGAINQSISDEIIRDLHDTNYLIYDEHLYIDNKKFKDFAPSLEHYIQSEYVEIYKFDERTSIFKRKTD